MEFSPSEAAQTFKWNNINVVQLMKSAYGTAQRSPERTQNGAVIVGPNGSGHWSDGFNVNLWPTREGYDFVVHAEEDAILKFPIATMSKDSTLVCPWLACPSCARKIVRVGIKVVWRHANRTCKALSNEWWKMIQDADVFLKDNGVTINEIVGPIDAAPSVKIRGQAWSPETLEYVDAN